MIGGGSGHEPTFLGFVGKGLADAAAIGNVFASPPPDPALQCAKAISGAGVLFFWPSLPAVAIEGVQAIMNNRIAAYHCIDSGMVLSSHVCS